MSDRPTPPPLDLEAIERRYDAVVIEPSWAAYARTDVPALVAEVRRLRADLAAARAALEHQRAAAMIALDWIDEHILDCCGAATGQQFCEQYGCSTLADLADPIRAALADRP